MVKGIRHLIICGVVFFSLVGNAQWEYAFDDMLEGASATGNWWDGLGLTAVWPIDDGKGTSVSEKVGGKSGVFVGVPSWATLGGLSALYLNGSSYLNVGDNLDITTNGVLVSAWIWCAKQTASTPQVILSKSVLGAPATRYTFGLNSVAPPGRPYILANVGGDILSANQNTIPISLSNWVHVAGVIYRSGFGATYTNGLFEASVSGVLSTNSIDTSGSLLIGTDAYSPSDRTFTGYIRDVCVKFNGTTNDIIRIYNATKSRYGR